jgi:repressor LexA
MELLTKKQRVILDFIRRCINSHGMPPTRAEICTQLGFSSPNAAEQHLRALEKKGAIEILSGISRGIRLLEEPGLPLVGTVAAGSPILAEENLLGRYPVDPALFQPHADYLLRVRGLSMKDAGILDRDWVAVHKTAQASNGQIVVARIGSDVTVKRFRRKGHTAYLIAENPDLAPITVDLKKESLDIEGLVVGVIRTFAK